MNWETLAGWAGAVNILLSLTLLIPCLVFSVWGAVSWRPENPHRFIIPVHAFWLAVPILIGLLDVIVVLDGGIVKGDWGPMARSVPLFAAMSISWLWSMQIPLKPLSRARREIVDPLVVPFMWIALWTAFLIAFKAYLVLLCLNGIGQ